MRFGAPRSDKERLNDTSYKHAFYDNKPTMKPEHENWVMRPREKKKEIGPEFRFNSNLQVERIMDDLTSVCGKYFDQKEICSDNTGFRNDEALAAYKKTRHHAFVPGIKPADYDSDSEMQNALKRENKLQQTTYIIPPRKIMSTMHRRTYFQGANSIKMNVNTMKVATKLFNEDFIEVANNIPQMLNVRKGNTSDCKARTKSENLASARKKKFASSGTISVDPEEEDRRLDCIQKMRN